MNKIVFIILILLTVSGCSSLSKIERGGNWTGYDFTYFCPTYTFSNTGQKSKNLDILNANHISLTNAEFANAFNTVNDYIKIRGGEEFFSKVEFYDVDISYQDSIKKFDRKKPLYDLEKCGDTKYFFRYLFTDAKKTNYRFGIALSTKNEIVSEHSFPDVTTNPQFYNIIGSNKAYRKANNLNRKLEKPVAIQLGYSSKNNCFIWEVVETKIVKSNVDSLGIDFVTFNAQTGHLIEKGTRVSTISILNSL